MGFLVISYRGHSIVGKRDASIQHELLGPCCKLVGKMIYGRQLANEKKSYTLSSVCYKISREKELTKYLQNFILGKVSFMHIPVAEDTTLSLE